MQYLTLTIADINCLNAIQTRLSQRKSLNDNQREYLSQFLSQVPTLESLLLDKVPLNETFAVTCWNTAKLETCLLKWIRLFQNLPGYDYAPSCYMIEKDSIDLSRKGIIMTVTFAPSMSYNASRLEGCEIHLKDDGTATFWLPTLADAEKYSGLYNFKGTWKEAYIFLIETLQNGWPMEEFPKEFQKFLPKS